MSPSDLRSRLALHFATASAEAPAETTPALLALRRAMAKQAKPAAAKQAKRLSPAAAKRLRLATASAEAPAETTHELQLAQPWRAMLYSTPGRSKDSRITPANPNNTCVFLTNLAAWQGVLAFDERLAAPVFLRKPPIEWHLEEKHTAPAPYPRLLTEADGMRIQAGLLLSERAHGKLDDVRGGVLMCAQRAPFDPVGQYLDELAWDGVARLDTWLTSYLGADDAPYTRAVSARTLIGAIARTRRPGCKLDTMLVLEGKQGAGKSRALAALMPDAAWFTDSLGEMSTKEGAHGLLGKWLIELAELSALRRAENESLKAFLSRGADHFRRPYGKDYADFPRRCFFVGTTNADVYLRDSTGGRRFWPVAVGQIDVDAIARDRDQLWAEADARFQRGEPWWLHEPELTGAAGDEQEHRLAVDSWVSIIGAWLDEAEPLERIAQTLTGSTLTPAPRQEVTIADVLSGALQLDVGRHDQAVQNRAAEALRQLGWAKSRARREGSRKHFYTRPRGPGCPGSVPGVPGLGH